MPNQYELKMHILSEHH